MNVSKEMYILKTFIIHLRVYMHQKKKIAAKVASVNGPLDCMLHTLF